MKHIPIVMATDNSYIPLVTALASLVENAASDTFYDIYILVDDSFKKELGELIRKYLDKYKMHCSLYFKNVGSIFSDTSVRIRHITRPTYYRLMIPDLLEEDRCIYLDTDTIVLSDLQELFQFSLDDCYVGGVRHPGVTLLGWESAVCKNADIPSAEQYVNAGVLVMNLKLLRKDKMVKKCMNLIPKNMVSQDQDIINHAFYGKIKFLPFKYNVIAKLADFQIENYKGCYLETEIREAWNAPSIIHYAGASKPWNSIDSVFMDYWWYFFWKSKVHKCDVNGFFRKFVVNSIYHSCENQMFNKKLPRLFDLAYRRRYVIYGAGKRATDVIAFLKNLKITPEFIVVSENAGNSKEIGNIAVRNLKEAHGELYGKTIIIATMETMHMEIIENLQGYEYDALLPLSDKFSFGKE